MPKGPKISPNIRRFIVWEAIDQLDKPRRVLAVELLDWIKENVDVRTLPELESITKIISTVRQKIPRKEDHWSVGASTIHNISAEATADLIKISKWCLVVGRDCIQIFLSSEMYFTLFIKSLRITREEALISFDMLIGLVIVFQGCIQPGR